jgi:hypothetical protein
MKIRKVFENIDDDICRELYIDEYEEYEKSKKGKFLNGDIEIIEQQKSKILNSFSLNTTNSVYLYCDSDIAKIKEFRVDSLEDYYYLVRINYDIHNYIDYNLLLLCERDGLKHIADKFLKEIKDIR